MVSAKKGKGLEQIMDSFERLPETERKMWRTLVRVNRVLESGLLDVCVPAYDPRLSIYFKRQALPAEIYKAALEGQKYFHAMANIGVEQTEYLRFSDWEIG